MSSSDKTGDVPWRPQPRRTAAEVLSDVTASANRWSSYLGWRRIFSAIAVVVIIAIGALWLFDSPAPPIEQSIPFASSTTASTAKPKLIVHVAGAVNKPGVYAVEEGSRVYQVIFLAGGFTEVAEPKAVNLAALVQDAQQIYVPSVGEETRAVTDSGGGVATGDGKVNINSATASALEQLPGIGPATAASIIDYREKNGPFSSIEDLLRVSGIGSVKLDAIRELITL